MERIILIVAVSPLTTTSLSSLNQEVRDIQEGLQRALRRGDFKIEYRSVANPTELRRAMLDFEPQILHFSRRGYRRNGLVFQDEAGNPQLVDAQALAGLFKLFSEKLECVVLNGCYSEVQANAIAQHINYVIGINQPTSDKTAIEFAVAFYDALGAGRDIDFAYKLACNAVEISNIREQLTPVLIRNTRRGETEISNPHLAHWM